MEFCLPELGEGIEAATVVGVHVKAGDVLEPGQIVFAVETDKAAVDVPIKLGGSVEAVLVKVGDKVAIGGALLSLKASATAPTSAPKPTPAKAAPAPIVAPKAPVATSGSVEFFLPELGEGIEAATVVGILVKVGETVAVGQMVFAVETDKAAVEVPTSKAGVVETIHVKIGEKVPISGTLLTLKSTDVAAAPAAVAEAPKVAVATTAPRPAVVAALATNGSVGKKDLTPAGPATRRLARELGVALLEVGGTGRGGRVTLDNVKEFVKTERTKKTSGGTSGSGLSGKTVADSFAHPNLPDFAKFGEIERKPVSGIRKAIANNLTIAWRTIPMVTQNDLADITHLEDGRKRIVDGLPKGAAKITWTVLAVKAVVAALKEFPNFNASFDMNAGELIVKKFYHIGIAVDTERGLVVPVIRDADKKSIRDIAAEVASLAEKSRTGKLTIDEMRGGTFTLTNLGGIGGTSFTPIVNYPEVAILGMSRSAMQPVVRDGQVVARLMMPLSLTYDHRVIDGPTAHASPRGSCNSSATRCGCSWRAKPCCIASHGRCCFNSMPKTRTISRCVRPLNSLRGQHSHDGCTGSFRRLSPR